ncbi:MAG TPA: ABC transporter permease subunit [Steroidobacteraceae bacterium]|jgi:putative spermidine/putrescine transport system permease protein|nr:ABC transporter permease subunit [Steroidobacteraceae bacterium]
MTRALRGTFLALLALFLSAPLIVVTGVSFNGNARMNFPPQHVSVIWYGNFFSDAGWRSAFTLSLVIAALSSLVALSIALPLAYAVWRHGSRAARALQALARISFLLPSVVVSIVFLVFWSAIGHAGHIEDTILSHAVVFVTLPLTTIGLGFQSIDPALIDAARTLGARDSEVLRTVIRPILLPYAICGLVFVFILSLNEYIIAYMVAGFEVETLPIKVFNNLRMGFTPTMCVGAVLFMLLGVLGFGVIALIGDLPKLLGGRSQGNG